MKRRPGRCPEWGLAAVAVAAILATPFAAASQGPQRATDVVLKAAFVYNFVKFAEWPALRTGEAIAVCIVGDDGMAAEFDKTANGKSLGGHVVAMTRPVDASTWRACHVLFIADTEVRRSAKELFSIRTVPVLTVSDGPGFAIRSGLVELYVEDGRMRFAINVDALERSSLKLSSRLLGLARVIRDPDRVE
ncbi:MAG: YfiR family protein [Acidobacteriota bacterium]|nr:YfiR family protein [Acidobacteriota bacterium]